MEYETVIGLEVHLQLRTRTKAFCGCSTEFGSQPNTQVCPVCLGFPGTLPVLNKNFLAYGIKTALALNCTVQEYTKFDRKNYFYPDLPKDYQISQYDLPLSKNGFINIMVDTEVKRIGITRVHMEEDAGKLIHREEYSCVDFNRTGMPLLEIVSEPDMNSPQEAYDYLTNLKSMLEYLDVSDCDMEKGSLRCDANVSVRPRGEKTLGTKTELKNMNSFKAVRDALTYEIARQISLVESGEKVVQQTLLWNEKEEKTFAMRTKEGSQDYRYFPEPDLPPFIISLSQIEETRRQIPELPKDKIIRFMKDYGLSEYDACILCSSKKDSLFAESCLKAYPGKDKKTVANWLIGPLLSEANLRNSTISGLDILIPSLLELIDFVESQQISSLSGKAVLTEMLNTGKSAAIVVKEKDLIQVSDTSVLDKVLDEVIKDNPKSVEDYKSGKANAVMFLVGQAMKKSLGKANPKVVQDMLKRRLDNA
ncbi:MAG: Asp-tRNA(Asn)/Glu-tRNA(Gln) amidotransferase subunit GatB [Candidatus Omnitrophota bacterium]